MNILNFEKRISDLTQKVKELEEDLKNSQDNCAELELCKSELEEENAELKEANITCKMKSECMGEFKVTYPFEVWDANEECYTDEIEEREIPIAWDTMKDIYKMMHESRIKNG